MKIDLRKLSVKTDFGGKAETIDFSKQFGNYVYNHTSDIGIGDKAKEIYYKGEVELAGKQWNDIKAIVQNCEYILPIKVALMKIFEDDDKMN